MIDKDNKNNTTTDNQQDYSDDFLDDLDYSDEFADKTSDDYQTEAKQDDYGQHNKKGGVGEFLKTYGFVILIILVLGYFGLKFSLGLFFNSSNKSTDAINTKSTTTTQIPTLPVLSDGKSKSGSDSKSVDIKDKAADLNKLTATAENKTEDKKDQDTDIFDPLKSIIKDKSDSDSGQTSSNSNSNSKSETQTSNNTYSQDDIISIKQELDNFKNSLDEISKKITNHDDDLNKETNNIVEIKQQMQQLLIYVQGVSKALGLMSTEIRKQKEILTSLVARDIGSIDNNTNSAENNNSSLRLEAIIPGRAWFKDKNDKELTVKVGDFLPGYGKVIEIDYKNGSLTTDSGAVFKQ